jgi:hypothetical protein
VLPLRSSVPRWLTATSHKTTHTLAISLRLRLPVCSRRCGAFNFSILWVFGYISLVAYDVQRRSATSKQRLDQLIFFSSFFLCVFLAVVTVVARCSCSEADRYKANKLRQVMNIQRLVRQGEQGEVSGETEESDLGWTRTDDLLAAFGRVAPPTPCLPAHENRCTARTRST